MGVTYVYTMPLAHTRNCFYSNLMTYLLVNSSGHTCAYSYDSGFMTYKLQQQAHVLKYTCGISQTITLHDVVMVIMSPL